MSNFERNKKAIDDFFSSFSFKDKETASEFFDALKPSERAIRYVRHDVSVSIHGIFSIFFLSFGKDCTAKLLNISSQGALIASQRQFAVGKKITLNFKFNAGEKFKIQGKIVNKRGTPPQYYYGIKFDYEYHDLGDYLLSTQYDILVLKS